MKKILTILFFLNILSIILANPVTCGEIKDGKAEFAAYYTPIKDKDGIYRIPVMAAREMIYNIVFQGVLNTTSIEEAESYKPIRKNIDRLVKDLSEYYAQDHNGEHPPFMIWLGQDVENPLKANPFHNPKPYVLRWNKEKNKYEEAYTLPVEENIVVIHDPDRFTVRSYTKECDDEWMEAKYNLLSAGFNTISNEGIATIDHKWQKGAKMAYNATVRYIHYERTDMVKDKRNESILQFPIVKFPAKYKFIDDRSEYFKKDGSIIDENEIHYTKYLSFDAKTFIANEVFPDGSTIPIKQYDPEVSSVVLVPVDGYTVKDAEKSPYVLGADIIRPPLEEAGKE